MRAPARPPKDPALVERLERAAARHPAIYRLRLTGIAVGGDIALTTTMILPVAGPVALGVILLNHPLFYWSGLVTLLLLIWMVRPSYRLGGRELSGSEAPELFNAIAVLRSKLQVPGRMQVFLDDSFNASAAEIRIFFGLLRPRFALTLGVPLLAVVGHEHVLAVIAHEFGHFSRRHGRLGQWLYRTRAGWAEFARSVDESDSALDRFAAWYARRFVPYFALQCFIHARQCEYEADADAALATSSRTAAEALTTIAATAQLWNEMFPRQALRWRREAPLPPDDYLERFATAARESPLSELQSILHKELRVSDSWIDTHPSLAQRVKALGQFARLAPLGECAGKTLFGANWPNILAEFDARWQERALSGWAIDHLRFKHITGRLLEASAETMSGWNDDQRLARAIALRELDPVAGLAELRAQYMSRRSDPHVGFAYGVALLEEDDRGGVDILENLAKESRALRYSITTRVLPYLERMGEDKEIERWLEPSKRLAKLREKAISAFIIEAHAGRAAVSPLPREVIAVLAEAISLDPCTGRGWLLTGDTEIESYGTRAPTPVKIHLLVITVDPAEINKRGLSEFNLAARYEGVLETLIPCDEIAVARTFYTTEPLPDPYKAGSKFAI
jgi:Zn-dependent protease with chaperone function